MSSFKVADLERARRWLCEVWSEDERDLAALIACVREEGAAKCDAYVASPALTVGEQELARTLARQIRGEQ